MGVAELTSAGGERGVADPGQRDAAPICRIHGNAKKKCTDRSRQYGFKWSCHNCQREADARYDAAKPGRRKARIDRLKEAGLCTCCGKDVAVTETRCFDCARRNDECSQWNRL